MSAKKTFLYLIISLIVELAISFFSLLILSFATWGGDVAGYFPVSFSRLWLEGRMIDIVFILFAYIAPFATYLISLYFAVQTFRRSHEEHPVLRLSSLVILTSLSVVAMVALFGFWIDAF